MWPGYGENSRVLKWIVDRLEGKAQAEKTPVGFVPRTTDLDTSNLSVTPEALQEILTIDNAQWKKETESMGEHFKQFGDRLPKALAQELEGLKSRL